MQRDGWLSQEIVSKAGLGARLGALRSDGYIQLTLLTVTDWIEDGEFEVTYILTNPHELRTVMLGVRVSRDGAELPTVSDVWPAAVTYEQEINEMFGIRFPGSPRQGVPFILEGWKDIPPMRRDFDTLAYSVDHYEDRPGRRSVDTRRFVGRVTDEASYGRAWEPKRDEGRKRRMNGGEGTGGESASGEGARDTGADVGRAAGERTDGEEADDE